MRCVMGGFIAWTIVIIAHHELMMSSLAREPGLSGAVQLAHMEAAAGFRRFWGGIGFLTFCLSAATDWLDGFLARKWNATSRFGRLLDPIADKIIVGLPLIAIAAATHWPLPATIPIAIIVFRDVLITVIRFIGLDASAMAVSVLAKFKTMIEMVVVAVFFVIMASLGTASPLLPLLLVFWLILLWIAAVLSAYTGLRYLFGLRSRPAPTAPDA